MRANGYAQIGDSFEKDDDGRAIATGNGGERMWGIAHPNQGPSHADPHTDQHPGTYGDSDAPADGDADVHPDTSEPGPVTVRCLQGMGRGQVSASQNDDDRGNKRNAANDA